MPPEFELNSFRFGFAILPICLAIIYTQQLPKVSRCDIKMLACGTLAYMLFNMFVYSHYIKFLPLGSVGAIINGFEIIWCIILSIFLDRSVLTPGLLATYSHIHIQIILTINL